MRRITSIPWHKAACLGQSDLFMATDPESVERAVEVCRSCEIVVVCRVEAMLDGQTLGVMGGLTPAERVVSICHDCGTPVDVDRSFCETCQLSQQVACGECGEPFVRSHPNQTICSSRCRRLRHRRTERERRAKQAAA